MSALAYGTAEGLLYVAIQHGGLGGFHVRSWRAGSWTDLGTAHAGGRRIFGLAFSHDRTGATPLLVYSHRHSGLGSLHAYVVTRWTHVRGNLPGTATGDHAIVAFGYQ